MKPLFVIEHLEPETSKWLLYEYEHASEIVGKNRLLFTNVKKKGDAVKLSRLGKVEGKSAAEIFSPEKVVILDPKAEEPLKPEDFAGKDAVIIGGILGDHPPKGRTRKLLTSRFPKVTARNIGKCQFSIDGAVYVAKLVSDGTPLEKIPVKKGLSLRLDEYAEVYLPYAYPLKDGKPVISQKLMKYLLSDQIVENEEELLKKDRFRNSYIPIYFWLFNLGHVLMVEEIKCPHCGAPYKKRVPEWVTSLQCPYCGAAILIPKKEENVKVSKIIYVEEVASKPQKTFSLTEFSEFMRKKGYVLDPISGALKMGTAIVYISEEGMVEGPEPYKTRAERWISEYMKQQKI